jgi:HSP20 family protein
MSVTQLIPWNRNRTAMVRTGTRDPFFALQREVNRLFDDMWNGFDLPLLRAGANTNMLDHGWPQIDLAEQDKEFLLTVEVPGLDEKDIEVQFADQCVILRGERHEERNADPSGHHYSERYYGRFERRIPLSVEIEPEKAKAVLRNGVLTVTLPKAAVQPSGHRIPISRAA